MRDGEEATRRRRGVATRILYAERMPPPALQGFRSKRALRSLLLEGSDGILEEMSGSRLPGAGRLRMNEGPRGLSWTPEVAIGWTAAIADSCGTIVDEDLRGWSGVEPFTNCWRTTPGACWFWRAIYVDGRASRGLVVDYVPACTAQALDSLRRSGGAFGWSVDVERGGDLVEVAYRRR